METAILGGGCFWCLEAAPMAERVGPTPVATEVMPAPRFWPAEDYHQNYLANNPNQPYCSAAVAPKAAKLRQLFKDRLK